MIDNTRETQVEMMIFFSSSIHIQNVMNIRIRSIISSIFTCNITTDLNKVLSQNIKLLNKKIKSKYGSNI